MTVFSSAATRIADGLQPILATRWGSKALAMLRGSREARGPLALVDQVIVGGANFLTILLLGRLAGAESLGLFALVMTVFYLLLAVQDALVTMPYTILGPRLKRGRHHQYSGAVLCHSATWAGCVGIVLAIVAFALFLFRDDASHARVVAAFAVAAPLWLFREFGRRYLFAHMQLTGVVAMSLAGATTQITTLGLLALLGQLSAATALCAIGIGSGVAGFGWLWLNRHAFRFKRARSSYFLLKNWVLGRWILASQGMNVLSANMMFWLIAFWLGPTATGLFLACDSILRLANPIIMSLNNYLTPWAAIGLNNGGKAELRRIVWKATTLLGIFLCGFTLVIAVGGHWILDHSFGSVYAGSWATLLVLTINQLVAKLSLAAGRALLVLERANINLVAEAAGLLTSLAAAPLLIPMYGILGAACSLLAGSTAMSAVNIGVYFAASRKEQREPLFPMGPVPSAATIGGTSE